MVVKMSKPMFSVKAQTFHKMMTSNLFCQGRDLYESAVKAGKRDIRMVIIIMITIMMVMLGFGLIKST